MLKLQRWQAISWSNDDKSHLSIFASSKHMLTQNIVQFHIYKTLNWFMNDKYQVYTVTNKHYLHVTYNVHKNICSWFYGPK